MCAIVDTFSCIIKVWVKIRERGGEREREGLKGKREGIGKRGKRVTYEFSMA